MVISSGIAPAQPIRHTARDCLAKAPAINYMPSGYTCKNRFDLDHSLIIESNMVMGW
jgi:hypothetical protein